MKILIINASHRAGNTDKITEQVKDKFQGHEVRELVLREIEMKLPDGCENCAESEMCLHIEDQFSTEIEPSIRDYDSYVLATPVWSDNVTPLALIFWNRIVSWCHEDKMYLKDKKLAIIVHGMADPRSWQGPIDWIKGVCTWEECQFAGSLSVQTDSKVGDVQVDQDELTVFIKGLTR